MRYRSKRDHQSPITAKTAAICSRVLPSHLSNKRLPTLTLFAAMIIAPAYAQAALPAPIEASLSRANLTASDISLIVTPVGDKNASRLPASVQVIDSRDTDRQSTRPSDYNAVTANENNSSQNVTKTDNLATNITTHTDSQSALITIEQRTIEQHERKIHTYTNDPYTYQSVEGIPTVVPDENPSLTNDDNSAVSTDNASVKISFSPLLNHQPDVPRTPASTMKLVPTFIALDTLGAGFVWHTRVYHTGIQVGDTLMGDLIIQGSGDPKMTHERLKQLLYQVQATGIRHINGDIIVDSSIFESVSKDPAAFDNAPLRPYNASPDGFLVNFSTVGIKTYPLDNDHASLTYKPRLANYQLPNKIRTRDAACGQVSYSLSPQWQAERLALNASLPKSCGEHVFYVAYPDAKTFAAHVIAAEWQALGNTLSGQVISQETPYNAKNTSKLVHGLTAITMSPLPMVSYPSLDLTQQIYDINHFSNNVMTEQVALSIGAYDTTERANMPAKNSTQKAASLYQYQPMHTDYPAALTHISQWWQTNLSTPPPYLTNGSGLCRDCTITAANLSELLTYAYNHPSFDAYVDSLGIAGVSGTIAAHSERLPDSAAIGRAWIKTGTLNNVTSMAGYVKGLSGQDYVVVGMINTDQALNPYTARPVLDAVLDWTAQR